MTGPRPKAAIHVDLDGVTEVYGTHGWGWSRADDPVFESGMQALLDYLDEENVRATLFVIGTSVGNPRKRGLLEEAVRRGHELASHTMRHRNLLGLSREEKRRELEESRAVIAAELGVEVHGFRAPGYQVDRETVELLDELGYRYDSSAFPTATFAQRLGTGENRLETPGRPYDGLALCELPLPDHRPSPVPINPSYAHLLGVPYFRWGMRRMARSQRPTVLLFHLIDLAAPLARADLRGVRSRIFTLSTLSQERKLSRCRMMMRSLREVFEVVTTGRLLEEVPHEPVAGSQRPGAGGEKTA